MELTAALKRISVTVLRLLVDEKSNIVEKTEGIIAHINYFPSEAASNVTMDASPT